MLEQLTEREKQTLFFLCKGCLNKEISTKMGITTDTVKKHNKQIFKKLGVRNRTEAIVITTSLQDEVKSI